MKERDDLHQSKLADLRRDLAAATQVEAGQIQPFDEETVARVKARGRAKLAAKSEPGQA